MPINLGLPKKMGGDVERKGNLPPPKMGVEEYVRDYSCDADATRRRVERVCHDIEKLIGPDARGVTVEVDGSRCGEAEPQKKKKSTPQRRL